MDPILLTKMNLRRNAVKFVEVEGLQSPPLPALSHNVSERVSPTVGRYLFHHGFPIFTNFAFICCKRLTKL